MHEITKQACPNCGNAEGSVSNLEEGSNAPKPGDHLLCYSCQVVLIVEKDLTMRSLREEEITPQIQERVKAAGNEIRFTKFFSTFEEQTSG